MALGVGNVKYITPAKKKRGLTKQEKELVDAVVAYMLNKFGHLSQPEVIVQRVDWKTGQVYTPEDDGFILSNIKLD